MRTNDEEIRFVQLVQALAAQFRVECDEALLLGYDMALADLSIEQIQNAVAKACRESQFMPTGAELRKLAGIESPNGRALLAWNVVAGAVKTVGSWASVDFDDPVTNAAIRSMGGWVSLCGTNSGDDFDKWAAQRFQKIYCELWRIGVSEEMARPHIGLSDQSNGATGHLRGEVSYSRIACGLSADPSKVKRLESKKPVQRAISKLAGALTVEQAIGGDE